MKRRISVVGAAIVASGKVLIARRPPHETGAGLWEFPGGKVEPGESPSQAILREIDEELGIQIRVRADLGAHFHSYPTVDIDIRVFLCEQVGGELELREHDAVEWRLPTELDAGKMLEADGPFIERLIQAIGPVHGAAAGGKNPAPQTKSNVSSPQNRKRDPE